MAFFLQRRIQPLQSRPSKLWTYSGLTDPSQVYTQDLEKKDLDKRVRSLTTLTVQMEIPNCTAAFFDSTHPLPKVYVLLPKNVDFSCSFLVLRVLLITIVLWIIFIGPPVFGFSPSSSRGRTYQCSSCPCWVWSPRGWWDPDGDEAEGSMDDS
jgi:hypothetical protein